MARAAEPPKGKTMVDTVALSPAARASFLQTQSVAILTGRTTERLSTGLKINSALDGAQAFFAARSLNDRASDLLAAKDRINQGVSTVGAAIAGTQAIENLADQAKALALTAKGGTAAERQQAAEQFDALRTQIDNLAGDAPRPEAQSTERVMSDTFVSACRPSEALQDHRSRMPKGGMVAPADDACAACAWDAHVLSS